VYRTFAHTADVGLRIEAADLNTLFAEAGRGFFSLIVVELESVECRIEQRLEIEGSDLEFLLVDWLNELLFLYESQRLLLRRFEVAVGPEGLRATVSGEPFDESRHQLDHEVKAVTYHGLKVQQAGEGWNAEVILDI
jgi:SHS2 domain-containing protein